MGALAFTNIHIYIYQYAMLGNYNSLDLEIQLS